MISICVIGSVNMDFFTISERFPMKGETVIGKDFFTQPGGKGGNQAVSAARLGANVFFIGACGNDYIHDEQIRNFQKNNIDIEGLEILEGPSGIAQITVSEEDNTIIVVPGANGKVDIDLINKHKSIIDKSEIVLLQMEIPLETIEYIIDYAFIKEKIIILNPAPAHKISEESIRKCTYITPNEIEINQIFEKDFELVLKEYPNKVIMTKGSDGVYYHDGLDIINIAGEKTDVVDTTGAGDTFNGAFAYAIGMGLELSESITFANRAASLSITKLGAQAAMPTLEEMNHE